VKLLDANQSRELDRLSREEYGVESYALMTRAGEAVAEALLRHWPDRTWQGVAVIAGRGNNGGDGFVAARRLAQQGVAVRVLLLTKSSELRGDAARACREFAERRGEIIEIQNARDLETLGEKPPAAILDAVFGTGLNAEVSGLPRAAIELVNSLALPVVAVDIASGVSSDTGAIMGVGVKAALTVTFGFAKYGHVSYPGAELCGELEIADIGFARGAIADLAPSGLFVEEADVRPLLKRRSANTHKGTYGHLLIVAGSRGKSGAALLAARGALRAGAGLVTAAIPEPIAPIVAVGQAELMTEAIPARDGHFAGSASCSALSSLLEGKSAIVAGPGIGVSDETKELVSWLITEGAAADRPLLVDADALNSIAAIGAESVSQARGPVVLTPHPGEMARLLGLNAAAVNADRISAARKLCERTRAWVLLKGARSVIASPSGELCVNSSGNPGMATAGMGDALAGILGTFLGQGMRPLDALVAGVFAHGYAADCVASRYAPFGYLTGDVIDELPRALGALVG
jgi:ADP-dependent NAD(P)H-hydrate dehydratase / NAD(P)H-hydrate epimerase